MLPKSHPTTVGIVAKNDPLAAPLMTTNITNGTRVSLTGHMTSMLVALRVRPMSKAFNGPMLSARRPETTRPKADEKLKAATRHAPVDADKPILRE